MKEKSMSIEIVPVSAREIQSIADLAVKVSPNYMIRKTESTTFRCLTLLENEKENWKKGIVYFIARYSKGVNFEMWMYSTKGGAQLAEFNDLIRPLAIGSVKVESLGHALKLRLQLPDAMKDEDVESAIKEMMDRIEPTLQEIRGKIKIVVSEKKTVVKKEETKKIETPIPVLPQPTPPAPVVEDEEKEEIIPLPPTESEMNKNRRRRK